MVDTNDFDIEDLRRVREILERTALEAGDVAELMRNIRVNPIELSDEQKQALDDLRSQFADIEPFPLKPKRSKSIWVREVNRLGL